MNQITLGARAGRGATGHSKLSLHRLAALATMVVAGSALSACGSSSPKASSPTTVGQTAAVNTLLSTGVKQAEAKDYSKAEDTFQDVLALDPGNELAWYNLGLIAQTEKNPKQAIADYQRALKTDPRDTSALYNEAIAVEPTDRREALSLYKQIVTINPKASTAYLRMSFLYLDAGDKKDASAARAKALALDPSLGSVAPPTTTAKSKR